MCVAAVLGKGKALLMGLSYSSHSDDRARPMRYHSS